MAARRRTKLARTGTGDDPAQDAECVSWAREFSRATAPFAAGGVYVNFLSEDESDRVGAAYAGNHQRLVALKNRYDPANRFRLNQNIQPTAVATPTMPA